MNSTRGILLTKLTSHLFVLLCISLSPVIPANAATGSATQTLTLPEAIQRSLDKNPTLQVYGLRKQGLQGLAKTEGLNPGFSLTADVENLAGTGAFTSTGNAEATLALSSVVELGDKRAARLAVVDARGGQLESERRANALDLLGNVTRQYIEVATAQERVNLASNLVTLAHDTVRIVERRVDAGASPGAELLRARTALSQFQLTLSSEQSNVRRARVSLALLWGESQPDFLQVSSHMYSIPALGDFDELLARAKANPSIEIFSSERRLREAELRLAKTQSKGNVSWSLGARQIQGNSDQAIVASLSIPLFSENRSRGLRQSASAALEEVRYRRDAALLNLHAGLWDAYQQYSQAITEVEMLKNTIVPQLQQALDETKMAYENGRYSYLEWVSARQALAEAQRQMIDSASSAHRHQANIEQLTGEPLTASETYEQTSKQ